MAVPVMAESRSWRQTGGLGRPSRQETDLAQTEKEQRVEVETASQESPVQTGRTAVTAGVLNGADDLTGRDDVTGPDQGVDRQVGGAKAAGMEDRHDSAARDPLRQADGSRPRGEHLLARLGGEIHTPVTGQPALRRRVEAPDRPCGHRERPPPAGRPPVRPREMRTAGQAGRRRRRTRRPRRAAPLIGPLTVGRGRSRLRTDPHAGRIQARPPRTSRRRLNNPRGNSSWARMPPVGAGRLDSPRRNSSGARMPPPGVGRLGDLLDAHRHSGRIQTRSHLADAGRFDSARRPKYRMRPDGTDEADGQQGQDKHVRDETHATTMRLPGLPRAAERRSVDKPRA